VPLRYSGGNRTTFFPSFIQHIYVPTGSRPFTINRILFIRRSAVGSPEERKKKFRPDSRLLWRDDIVLLYYHVNVINAFYRTRRTAAMRNHTSDVSYSIKTILFHYIHRILYIIILYLRLVTIYLAPRGMLLSFYASIIWFIFLLW